MEQEFWQGLYDAGDTKFDLGGPSAPLVDWLEEARPAPGKAIVPVFRLSGQLAEAPVDNPFPFFTPPQVSLRELVTRMNKAADDANVKAVVINSEIALLGPAQLSQDEQPLSYGLSVSNIALQVVDFYTPQQLSVGASGVIADMLRCTTQAFASSFRSAASAAKSGSGRGFGDRIAISFFTPTTSAGVNNSGPNVAGK